MNVVEQGLIFDNSDAEASRKVTAFAALCVAGAGSIFSVSQIGPIKNAATSTLLLCRSHDRGRTWQTIDFKFEAQVDGVPGSLSGGEMVEVAPGRLLLIATWFDRSDPSRLLFDAESGGILHSKQLLAESTDDGASWSSWREIDTAGLKGCALTGPILQWPDGAIGFAFESFKEFDDPRPGHHAAWLMISRDQGESFSDPMRVAEHPVHEIYYWDQRLCTAGGKEDYLALFWSHDLAKQKDLNVHLGRGRLEGDALKCDPIVETSIPGQIAAPVWLDDGRLVAFVVERNQTSTLTLWMSRDEGVSWPEKLVVYNHQEQAAISQGSEEVDFNEYWEDMAKWSFGHPVARSLGNELLLSYYAGPPDQMSLHWARVGL